MKHNSSRKPSIKLPYANSRSRLENLDPELFWTRPSTASISPPRSLQRTQSVPADRKSIFESYKKFPSKIDHKTHASQSAKKSDAQSSHMVKSIFPTYTSRNAKAIKLTNMFLQRTLSTLEKDQKKFVMIRSNIEHLVSAAGIYDRGYEGQEGESHSVLPPSPIRMRSTSQKYL